MARPGAASEKREGLPEEDAGLRQLVAEFPPLEDAETARLLAQVDDRGVDQEPRRALVQHHLWIVLDEATARQRPEIPLADLFQEGSTALLKVVHGLAPGTSLGPQELRRLLKEAVSTAISVALEEETQARARDQAWAEDAERLFLEEAEITASSGLAASDRELAGRLGWTEDRVRQMRRAVAEASAQHDEELAEILGEMAEE